MTVDIGNIIISKIETLPFIDKYAGVVKTLSYKDDKGAIKSFPASVQTTLEECGTDRYKDLVLDSSKKSVLFLEDRGTRLIEKKGDRTYWRSSLNIVCWLNMPKLGYSGASYSSVAIIGIISKFPLSPFSSSIYNLIDIQVQGQEPKSVNPFQRYSFEETEKQYLMYPYDYFVLPVDVEFMILNRCLSEAALETELNCTEK